MRPTALPTVSAVHGATTKSRVGLLAAIAGIALAVVALRTDAQQLTRPVYRVAATGDQTPAVAQAPAGAQPSVAAAQFGSPAEASAPSAGSTARRDDAVRPVAAAQPASMPFDVTQREGEHPLMPCLRMAKQALVDIDREVRDYECTFKKIERFGGSLGDPQTIYLRVRHEPFSVYMRFITPNPGQEVLYVEGQNNGKLLAMGSGWKRRFGAVKLDPEGAMAMRDQRYPITKAGIRNLTAELIEIAEKDTKFAECDVRYTAARIEGRAATMIEAVHPVPRRNFRYHKAQIFIDNELRLPIAYRAYTWPRGEGQKPPLEEQYVYANLKINNGFTDADFSADNPEMFK